MIHTKVSFLRESCSALSVPIGFSNITELPRTALEDADRLSDRRRVFRREISLLTWFYAKNSS